MGSGFVPSGRYSAKMGRLAAILAETDGYLAFVGATIYADGASGMYFYGVDVRDLTAAAETWPAAYVVWDFGEDFERYSVQAGGGCFRYRGTINCTFEADTPALYAEDTPGALNWFMGKVEAMLGDMEDLFGVGAREEVARIVPIEGPFRSPESDEDDFLTVTFAFEPRN